MSAHFDRLSSLRKRRSAGGWLLLLFSALEAFHTITWLPVFIKAHFNGLSIFLFSPWLMFLAGIVWLTIVTFYPVHSILNDKEIQIFKGNLEMAHAINILLRQRAGDFKKVKIVQYSGANIKWIVCEIMQFTTAHVEVYLVEPTRAKEVNEYQKNRTEKELENFPNETRQRMEGAQLDVFTYDAPGAVRAILIENVALFFGCYQYTVIPERGYELDTRGKELPMFMIPCAHRDFQRMTTIVENMLKSWRNELNPHTKRTTAIEYKNSFKATIT